MSIGSVFDLGVGVGLSPHLPTQSCVLSIDS